MAIFKSTSYRTYLTEILDSRRGMRSELAAFLGCQSGYISQVLQEMSNFSMEQGIRICQFLKLTEDEAHFFLLQLQHEKASTDELKKYFQQQMTQIKKERETLKNRLKLKTDLADIDHAQYYSSWEYAALHILASIPEFQTKEKMRKKLKLSYERTSEILEFLVKNGLVEEKGNRYVITAHHLHLDKNSPYFHTHYRNWRMQSMHMISEKVQTNINYTGLWSVSKADAHRIKEALLKTLEQTVKLAHTSNEEEMVYIGVDMNTF